MKKIIYYLILALIHNYSSFAEDYYLYGWGQNSSGQLGQNNTINYNYPKKINLSEVKKVLSGRAHNLVFKSDSTIWAWGNNSSGQVGDGSYIPYIHNQTKSLPLKITNDKWNNVFIGDLCSFAIALDSSLWGWGSNSNGQLAYLDSGYLALPTRILDEKFIFIEGGDQHTLAIKEDSTLWSWGRSDYGQMGAVGNNFGIYLTPQKVGNDKWLKVTAGGQFSVGIKSDSSLWSWGRNDQGQVGNGVPKNNNQIEYETEPILINNSKWIQIDAGYSHTLAIKSDSTLWAWGYNINGALGDGTNVNRIIPTLISGEKWIKISAGENFSIAMRSDSILFATGYNNNGQLGINNNINQNRFQSIERKSNGHFSNGQHSIAILNSNIPSNIPTTGLVAYYPFNGNANDESGNGNHGIVNGPVPSSDKENLPIKSFQFDGIDDKIEIQHNDIFNIENLTISMWFKADKFDINGFGPHLISKREVSGWGSGFQMNIGFITPNTPGVWADWQINNINGGLYYEGDGVISLDTNNWYHLVYKHNSNEVQLIINNVFVASMISPGTLDYNNLPIWIGARPFGNHQWFKGKIDEVAIWSRSLNSQEISNLYNENNSLSQEPTRQSKDIKVFKITKNSIGIRWTKGNGENRAVLASEFALNSDNYVADGTNYTAAGFGVNQANTPDSYVVYNGNSNTCEITNLQNNKLYYFRIYEYNGTGSNTNYLTTSERSNPNSRMTLRKESEEWEEATVGYSLNIYPNPAKDFINIEMNLPFEGGELIIVDNEGREVYKSKDLSKLLNLDITNFLNGTYHILISNGEEAIYNSFVIER